VRFLTYISVFLFSVQTCGQKHSKIHYNSFNDFCEKLTNNKNLELTDLLLNDTLTLSENIGKDSLQETFRIKFTDCELKFVKTRKINEPYSYSDISYIYYNNQKILPDTNIGFIGLEITSAAKASLNGTTYLILSCWTPGCNGTFCRAKYDQLFRIKGKEITHQIIEGWQHPENIYCDINNDNQLDIISFIGSCFSERDTIRINNPDKYFFCIQAETLVNKKWVSLTDKDKKPYYIYLQTDDFFELETFKVIDYHWMKEL